MVIRRKMIQFKLYLVKAYLNQT